MARTIKAELKIPYGHSPEEAQGFTLRIADGDYGAQHVSSVDMSLGEALALMRELVQGLNDYRTAMQAKLSADVETTIESMDALIK